MAHGPIAMDTVRIDTFLMEAGEIIGGGAFSARLSAIAEAGASDKAALAAASDPETQAAFLRAGELRIHEAMVVVRAAATRPGPPI
jgi:hypothetical protein